MKYLFYLLLAGLILIRYLFSLPKYKEGDFVKITTTVRTEPVIYDTVQYLKIYGLKVYLPKYPEITYGDRIEIVGTISNSKLQVTNYKLLDQSKNILYVFRQKLILFYKQSLPEPYSSLVAGVVIGSKQMPISFWEKLKQTGTAHVVVASGTNITMTISFLIALLTTFLNRKKAIWITLLGVLLYVTISGFEAPIVRAGIMGSILLLGQERGRVVNSWRILIYSCVIMLLIKPLWITDLGFILSFTATTFLMFFQKRIDLRLKTIPAIFREGLSTSLAAQIGVAPIIYMTFGQFNLLSPIINALILWTIPYIMILGAVGGVVGLIIPMLGRLILYIAYPMLWYFVITIEVIN